jgi:uncharacterized phage protein (TIGR01671 family)
MKKEFRVWDIENKKYLPGILGGLMFNFSETSYDYKSIEYFLLLRNLYVVEQWTGLLDNNGKKIFEGDLVESDDGVGGRMYGHVEMIDGSFCIVFTDIVQWTFNKTKNVEVIGNIFENPELL